MRAEKYRYVSGWCGNGNCRPCAGSYAGTACTCECHTAPHSPPFDPAPLLAPVWTGTASLAHTRQENNT